MTLNADHVRTMLAAAGAGSGLIATPATIANLFNDAMIKHGGGQFNTTNRVAALLSESMMESAYFRTTVEYSNVGPYQPYRGRTFIQLTWSTNYRGFGQWCKARGLLSDANRFVNHPVELGRLEWAALGPVYYFTSVKFHGKPLVEYANNIDQVGKAVNLGNPYSTATPNGHAARRAAFNAVVRLGSVIVPAGQASGDGVKPQPGVPKSGEVYLDKLKPGTKNSDSVTYWQMALNAISLKGGTELGLTGDYGTATVHETKLFQDQKCNDAKDGWPGAKQATLAFQLAKTEMKRQGVNHLTIYRDSDKGGLIAKVW